VFFSYDISATSGYDDHFLWFEYGLKYKFNLRHLIAFDPEPGYLLPEGSNFMVKSDVFRQLVYRKEILSCVLKRK
jgi:hypothetical protein